MKTSNASETPGFPKLSIADVDLLKTYGIIQTYRKNTILIHEGDCSDSFFVVINGSARVYVSESGGKELTLSILKPGECFGESAIIEGSPRSATVATHTTATLVVVSRVRFIDCLGDHPQLAVKLLRMLSERSRALTQLAKKLALLDVYKRVSATLLALARDRGEELVIDQRFTHQDIASMVGASREMVSRVMKELSKGDYISVRVDSIVIKRRFPSSW